MMKLLIVLVIVLGIIAIAQLTRVYQLSAQLRNRKEEDVVPADNRMNARLMLIWMVVFFVSSAYMMIKYGDYLPPSASEHGESLDALMRVNMYLIIFVFFVVNFLLYYFAFKYQYNKNRKAKFFPHDNKLELIWTVVPSIVLAGIIIFGLITWNKITDKASEGAMQIELYSKQFDWTARYPGDNAVFGASNYNLITSQNPLGIVTQEGVDAKIAELEAEIKAIHDQLEANVETPILADSKVEALTDKMYRLKRHIQRILELDQYEVAGLNAWEAGNDDKIVKGEFHIPTGQEVEFIFRSRDVIHSAFMPHLRAQMNTVPGMTTRFKLTPIISTDSMRIIQDDPNFDYILLCNKICGAAHFNMQMKIVIDTPEDYAKWLAGQKLYKAEEVTNEVEEATSEMAVN